MEDKIWNGQHYSSSEYGLIEEAKKLGFSDDEINLFACLDKHNYHAYSLYSMRAIFEAIISYGANSEEVNLLCAKSADGRGYWKTRLLNIEKLLEKGFTVDFFKNFLNPPEQLAKLLSLGTLFAIIDAVESENRTLEECTAVVDEIISKAAITPKCLFKEPTAMYLEGSPAYLEFDDTAADAIDILTNEKAPIPLVNSIVEKDDEGYFKHSFFRMEEFAPGYEDAPQKLRDVISTQKPDGSYIFSGNQMYQLISLYNMGMNLDDILKVAITDESGTPVIDTVTMEELARLKARGKLSSSLFEEIINAALENDVKLPDKSIEEEI